MNCLNAYRILINFKILLKKENTMQALTKKQILLNNISVLENDDIIDTINNIVDFEIAKNFSLNKLTKEDLIERA